MGLQLSSVSSSANSSIFFSIRSASFQIILPRSLDESLRHAPLRSSKARRAATTARSTSAWDASTIWVKTSPVAGLMVSNIFAPSTHWPSIRSRPGLSFVFVVASMCRFLISIALSSQVAVCCRASLGMDGRGRPSPHKHSPHALLLGFEHCRPLLHVRGQTFLRVFTLEQQLLILAFHCQRRLHGNLPARL